MLDLNKYHTHKKITWTGWIGLVEPPKTQVKSQVPHGASSFSWQDIYCYTKGWGATSTGRVGMFSFIHICPCASFSCSSLPLVIIIIMVNEPYGFKVDKSCARFLQFF